MRATPKTKERIDKLKQFLTGSSNLLIVVQDNPDPDAIAAAVALRRLSNNLASVQCSIAHSGTVGRGENRALVNYLNINLLEVENLDFAKFDLVAIVDTQPGTGNNSLPEIVAPEIIIDHHPCRPESRKAQLLDIRNNYGATSTIMAEYLNQAGITPEMPLATALLYGIRSDTQDLGREASQVDINAIEWLYPLANKRMLSEIQRGTVPREYFRMLAVALKNARVCGNALVTSLGKIDNPDMIGEVADLLLREETTTWTMCMGLFKDKMLISLRASNKDGRAGEIVKKLVGKQGTGGGHQSYAGGQIPLDQTDRTNLAEIEKTLREKFIRLIGADKQESFSLIAPVK
jgi:nanoRNase/pAp phosphatase (c-di-AMP/oligoRNAs hydrolase)